MSEKSHSVHDRAGLPPEFQTLLRDYPREAWKTHPNFADAIQHWLDAHLYFKRMGAILAKETQSFLDQKRTANEFGARLGHYGNEMVQHLHNHHHWEDHQYFPELSAADDRFDAGLEMLETDHTDMDKIVESFTSTGNTTLQLAQQDGKLALDSAYLEAGKLLTTTQEIQKFLARHLADEEDLIVPILLHHKMRG
jgi:iron-sulfur cluster repair protein YtfE (RIC family)